MAWGLEEIAGFNDFKVIFVGVKRRKCFFFLGGGIEYYTFILI